MEHRHDQLLLCMYVTTGVDTTVIAHGSVGCGTADKKLAANARVDHSMSRLVALGNDAAPGCESTRSARSVNVDLYSNSQNG